MLRFLETFEAYNTTEDFFQVYEIPANINIELSSTGFHSGKSLGFATNTNHLGYQFGVEPFAPVNGSTVRAALAFRVSGSLSAQTLFSLANPTIVSNRRLLLISVLGTGRIQISPRYGAATTVQGNTNIGDGQWRFLEIELFLSPNADGYCRVWLDGALEVEYLGITVSGTVAEIYNQIGMTSMRTSFNVDNMIVWDDVNNGDGFTGRKGPFTLKHCPPVAIGDRSEMTVNPSGANKLSVLSSRATHPDPSFVAAEVGNADLYRFNFTSVNEPLAVALLTSAGSPIIREGLVGQFISKNGPDTRLNAEFNVNNTYNRPKYAGVSINPTTNLPWTKEELTNAQFGIERKS